MLQSQSSKTRPGLYRRLKCIVLQSIGAPTLRTPKHEAAPPATRAAEAHLADLRPQHSDPLPPFMRLPNELVFWIMQFLDDEYQLLLGRSCSRFRSLVNSNQLNLSQCDRDTRLRFLQYLEPDYPDMATCRHCGRMFRWLDRRESYYRCPHLGNHEPFDATGLNSYFWFMPIEIREHIIMVSPEVIDLMHRAHERGSSYGLPLSYLTTSVEDEKGELQTNEPRFVDGQLLLASTWQVKLGSEDSLTLIEKVRLLYSALCIHFAENIVNHRLWPSLEDIVTPRGLLKHDELWKCPFCSTDCRIQAEYGPDDHIKIILSVWRNYGRRKGNPLATKQIFRRDHLSRIGHDALSQRDLRGLYESAEVDNEMKITLGDSPRELVSSSHEVLC